MRRVERETRATYASPPLHSNTKKEPVMSIKSTRQFKDGVDEAFEAMKTRDKAKACYDFARDIAGSSRGGHRAPPEVSGGHLPRWA